MFLIYGVFFPALRILSLFYTAPLLNSTLIDRKIKLVIAFSISWLFSFFLPKIDIVIFSMDGFLIILEQIFIGMSLGFTMQLIFSSIIMCGELISLQMGLSFSSLFDIHSRSNMSPVSRFLYVFFVLLFFQWNGHIWMFSVLFDTFLTFPIKKLSFDINILLSIVNFYKYIFFDSLMLLYPILIIQLMFSLSMGILNRISPQVSIFSIGFTVILLVGMVSLFLFIPIFPSFCFFSFNRLQSFVLVLFNINR
ncbi:MAG: flagellar biosynthetic protein FliR [Buchnera aphidicola (Chaetogeoica yunlongensis)]